MRRKKRKLRVSFDLKLNLTRISYVKFDDPSNLMTLYMLSRFYFSDLFLYGKEITPYFMPRFILSGRKDSPAINYPFIYSCNLTEHGIELHSLPHPQIGCDISYQDVKWMEMFVIRRV